ncbi:hypothetical protein, partial [Pseudoalteromonas sp. D48-MNA-CIBAN-0056]|uniref:hypothetical protein n=1 Tax=Pseudoalteromonas sp. D48-MNA-CIBAN-0056 TaxID=3140417 RepID=UPI00332E381A
AGRHGVGVLGGVAGVGAKPVCLGQVAGWGGGGGGGAGAGGGGGGGGGVVQPQKQINQTTNLPGKDQE